MLGAAPAASGEGEDEAQLGEGTEIWMDGWMGRNIHRRSAMCSESEMIRRRHKACLRRMGGRRPRPMMAAALALAQAGVQVLFCASRPAFWISEERAMDHEMERVQYTIAGITVKYYVTEGFGHSIFFSKPWVWVRTSRCFLVSRKRDEDN